MQSNDVVIFSSSAIPGNAASIGKIINKLYLKGVEVYTNTSLNDIHTSGHANEEELKLMIRLIQPKYFMPFHGEYRMLKRHADIAVLCDIPKENTFVLQNGEVLSMKKGKIKREGLIQAGDTYVDGNRIGDVSTSIIRDRKIMASDGIIVIIASIDATKPALLGKVNISTRGFVLVNDNLELLTELENIARKTILAGLHKPVNYADIKSELITNIQSKAFTKTGRRPIILPIIMDVKKTKENKKDTK